MRPKYVFVQLEYTVCKTKNKNCTWILELQASVCEIEEMCIVVVYISFISELIVFSTVANGPPVSPSLPSTTTPTPSTTTCRWGCGIVAICSWLIAVVGLHGVFYIEFTNDIQVGYSSLVLKICGYKFKCLNPILQVHLCW